MIRSRKPARIPEIVARTVRTVSAPVTGALCSEAPARTSRLNEKSFVDEEGVETVSGAEAPMIEPV